MIPFTEQKIQLLNDLCKTYFVENLYLSGSAAKNKFTKESDLDFLVNFNSDLDLINYADNYFNFLLELQQLFDREIDLLTEKSLKNPILIDEINRSKLQLFESPLRT